jgi:hypothetical protein
MDSIFMTSEASGKPQNFENPAPRNRAIIDASCRLDMITETVDAEPLTHVPFCPDSEVFAGFSGSLAYYLFSALAGRHDDEDVIGLT